MTTAQRIIKYAAMALAVALIVGIFSGIAQLILGITLITDFKDRNETVGEMTVYDISQNIETVEITVDTATLRIEIGEKFEVHSNFNKMSIKDENGRLLIKEKSHNIFDVGNNGTVLLKIPDGETLNKVLINTGASSLFIEKLGAESINFDLGAGNVNIQDITVTQNAEIDCGIGELSIERGKLNNLELSHGVGKAEINADITGKSEIDAGVGELDLNMLSGRELYTVDAEAGIGALKIDGERVDNEVTTGNGKHFIKVEGGIGNVKINFDTAE
ncbi:MAG: DUF4097 domain-containing protein [Ruminococcaceae bacterium]|nr:DUF4097 domain-containing protein [Oscillospiraceae bacterium]